MLVVVFLMLVVAFARVRIWSDKDSRAMTLVLFLSVAGVFTTCPLFDQQVDASLAPTLGENMSDLIHVLILVARNFLIGLIALRLYDDRARGRWAAFIAAIAVAMIATSRLGHAADIPVLDEWELRDAPTVAYNVLYAVTLGATCALVIAGVVIAMPGLRGIRRGPFLALAAVGAVGVAYAITTITLLIAAPDILRDHAVPIVKAWSTALTVSLTLAGLYGLGRRRPRPSA
ncbi:hypothetical protein [Nocardia sp. SC052]|uniref:hypothetical protein n=1 Tax=Nocardia sichangensis TaxID=3385975 RepID=UPI0039A01630